MDSDSTSTDDNNDPKLITETSVSKRYYNIVANHHKSK